ncbi:hypothetical protein RJ40_00100 [Methanofollis aquaemaris]|uniref:DUF4013 domain-containing protein n=1 Tax=Methanofollis aquaemaris TaxID=126734 RepID=A0A8A3S321_9EURY|nr:hypothetical protein [Methanofollis aquaemaris]QSZ66014.1 hypothetical protein RJ40_00100 [Methanofollis aquaemaris]
MTNDFYAFGAIDAAISRTKSLLWPFNAGVWLRLAVIALFIGGVGGFNPFSYNFGGADDFDQATVPGDLGLSDPTILLIIGAVLLLALLFLYLGSVFQFVFVDCLSSGEISLSRTFGMRTGKGLRLFLFQALLILLLIAAMAFLVVLFVLPAAAVGNASILVGLIVLIPAILLLALVFGTIFLFTTDFVVPVMVADDCGVIAGWKKVWSFLVADLKNAAVYLVTRFVLGIVVGIAMFILVLLVLLIVGIPLGGIALLAMAFVGDAAPALFILLLVVGMLIAIPLLLLVQVPFVTFFRYYALLVLREFSPEHDLLAVPEA